MRRGGHLTRHAGASDFTSMPARTKPMTAAPSRLPRTSLSRSGGSKPRPNVGHPRNDTGPTSETRRLVLERDGYACVCCGVSVIGRRYSLGHRLRASQGGKPVPSNLLTFLGWGGQECHGRIDSRADPEDEARGYTVRSWDDPALVPVMVFEASGSGAPVYLLDDGAVSATPPLGGDA